MTQRRLRSLAILLAILALLVAACGPQEEATEEPPTAVAQAEEEETEAIEEATEEVAEEEDATEEATEEVAEEEDATEEATEEMAEEEDATEEATEEMAEEEDATEEATEEMAEEEDATEEATEEMAEEEDATEEATEEMAEEEDATEEATEEMAEEEDATEEATEEMAEEEDATEEATEEMAEEEDATEEATEAMMEETEMADMDGMEEVELVTFEGDVYSFDYPANFEADPSLTTDLVRLTGEDQVVVVVGPESYNLVLGGVEFESDSEALAFYLDRSGYDVGEETEMMMGVASYDLSLPRAGQVGAATLIDLENDRQGVVVELGPDEENVPNAAGAAIMGSIVYPPDIVDVAVNAGSFETLVTAVQAAGLEDTLRSGEFTVFAPTDDAFAALLEELDVTAEDLLAREDLADILTYHVVEGIVLAEDVVALDGEEVTTVNGNVLTIGVTDDGVTLTDGTGAVVNVVDTDIEASNGVIHVIDAVLLPPAPEPEPTEEATEEMADMEATEEATEEMGDMEATEEATEEMGDMEATEEATEEMGDMEATEEMAEMSNTIVDAAVMTPDLSSLAAAVVAADLVETLSGEGPFTVFAPTNEAFEAALEALELEFDDLVENTDLLTSILTYHVVEGAVLSTDLEEGDVETVNGATVTISFGEDGEVMVNDAMVTTADVEVDNGVVHIIDAVLVPPADDAEMTPEATEEMGDMEATAEATEADE